MEQVADALETAAGATTEANPNEPGRWKRIAAASEALAGAGTSANENTLGYMKRTAVALETISGTSGAEENTTHEGYLKRIVDALEVQAGAATEGSWAGRAVIAAANATFGGTPVWVPEGAVGFIDIPNERAWTEADGELTLAEVLAGYNAADITVDGLLIDLTHSSNTRLLEGTTMSGLIASLDTSFVLECTPGAFGAGGHHKIMFVGPEDPVVFFIENWNADFVYFNGAPNFYSTNNGAFIAPGTPCRFAVTLAATSITGSVNGRAATVDPSVFPAVPENMIFLGNGGDAGNYNLNGRLKYVEFY